MNTQSAFFFGVVFASFISALTVSLAFLRPMIRYAHARLTRERVVYADRLCAGIWTSAVGAVLISVVSMVRLAGGELLIGTACVAWVFIAGGYFLHFTAWRASMIGRHDAFAFQWAAALVGIAIAAGMVAMLSLHF